MDSNQGGGFIYKIKDLKDEKTIKEEKQKENNKKPKNIKISPDIVHDSPVNTQKPVEVNESPSHFPLKYTDKNTVETTHPTTCMCNSCTIITDETKIDTLLKAIAFNPPSSQHEPPLLLENSDDFMTIFHADYTKETKENTKLSKNNSTKKKKTHLFNPAKFYQNINTKACTKDQFLRSLISHTGTYLKRREGTDIYENWTNEILKTDFFPTEISNEIESLDNEIENIENEINEMKALFETKISDNLNFDLNQLEQKDDLQGIKDVVIEELKEVGELKEFEVKLEKINEGNELKLANKMLLLSGKTNLLSPHFLIKQMAACQIKD
ncbi:hypothetical protein CDIK_0441 [Cucumispora dikerogammari]|nr:hypothetical protein CDIK_0441 [Cucumispora dikerogammari]